MRKHIPNIITLLNLFAGTIAITHAFNANFTGVIVWVIIAAVFDFLDGMAARLLNAYSPLGKELDSLADVVSFGVAPASSLYILMRNNFIYPELLQPISQYIPYLAFIIPAFAAYRLAKFNIDTRQTDSFLGLPTPANGLFWISYCFALYSFIELNATSLLNESIWIITVVLIIIISILMVTEVPMFSFKLKSRGIKGNERQIILIILFITLISIFGIAGIAMGIISYILISILTPSRHKALNN